MPVILDNDKRRELLENAQRASEERAANRDDILRNAAAQSAARRLGQGDIIQAAEQRIAAHGPGGEFPDPEKPHVPQPTIQEAISVAGEAARLGELRDIFPKQVARREQDLEGLVPKKEPSTAERLLNAGNALLRTTGTGLLANVPRQVALFAKDIADTFPNAFPADADKDVEDFFFFQVGEAMERFFDIAFPQNPELKDSFFAEVLPGGAGSLLSLGITAAAVPGGMFVRGAATAAQGAAGGGVGQFKEAKAFLGDKPDADKEARQASRLGAALGLTEFFPVLRILNRFNKASGGQLKKGLGGAIREFATGGTFEGVQEGLATIGGNKIALDIYDKERDLMEGVIQAGAAGGLLGGLAAGIANVAGQRRARIAEQIADTDPFLAFKIAAIEEPSRGDFSDTLFADELEGKQARADTAKALREMGATEVPVGSPADHLGFAVIPDHLETGKKGFAQVRAFVKKWWASAGSLPKSVHADRVAKSGEINSILKQMTFDNRDYRKAVKEVYGKMDNMPTEAVESVNAFITGDLPEARKLPQQLHEPLIAMRNHVDALSTELIDIGAVEGELKVVVDQNQGFYLNRSFRVHSDPRWSEKVSQDVRDNAKAYLRQDFPDLDESEIDQMIGALLFSGSKTAKRPRNMIEHFGMLGAKDQGIFTKRKNIAKEIRMLLGENTDPIVNYSNTVQKMANVIANHKFLTKVRADGLGVFLYDRPKTEKIEGEPVQIRTSPVPPNVEKMTEQLSAEGNPAMKPLDGLWTTPDIAEAFREATDPQSAPSWLRLYYKANSIVKFSKTVGSPMTHVRNLMSNMGFAVANGHYRFWKSGDAARVVRESLGLRGDKKGDQAVLRERIKELQRLGVISDGARVGELRAVLEDALGQDVDTFIDERNALAVKRAGKKLLTGVTELYRAEDDVWKVFAFSNEEARYRKAKPNWTSDQIKRKAAENVRRTYPTYSQIPRAIRAVRRFPLVGTFVSFPAEVYRTGYQTIKLGVEEMADPDTKNIGRSRLIGLAAAAAAIPAALSIGSRYLNSVSAEEDEAVRELVPPWTENSALFHRGVNPETGNYRFIDMGYTTPYGYLYKPVMAALRGESWEEKMLDALGEAFEPFLSEEIFIQAFAEVRANEKKTGGPVYNEEAPSQDQASDILGHLLKPMEPGAITSGRRIIMGATGEVTDTGLAYDTFDEAMAVTFGIRPMEVNASRSLFHRERHLNGRLREANQILLRVVGRSSEVSEEEIAEAYTKTDAARRSIFAEMSEKVRSAELLGLSRAGAAKVLSATITGKLAQAAVLAETYVPYLPGKEFLVGAVKKIDVAGLQGADTREMIRRRAIVQRLALEAVRNR